MIREADVDGDGQINYDGASLEVSSSDGPSDDILPVTNKRLYRVREGAFVVAAIVCLCADDCDR